jgi:hypothetical protein
MSAEVSCGMTMRGEGQIEKGNGKSKDKSAIQGFFAALRMTT